MKLRNMLYMAMFAAVVGVLGLLPPIPLPLSPVPITAQTLGVMLAGSLLGARLAGGSMLLFVALIAAGMPLLAGGRGGIGVLIGPSGGYIIAWPFAAFVIGLIVQTAKNQLSVSRAMLANIIGGIIITYAFGITYLSILTDISWGAAAFSSIGFLPGDTIKAIIASYVAVKMARQYPVITKRKQNSRNRYNRAAG
ncbi:biotin transporter BioY [Alteribacillus sp. HJP-4]|uniref:biotin transporter BioY n=1 Tax=Alteribacillus sp. HJP-4 TaxID=2775394 RepID=UPI0035CCE786